MSLCECGCGQPTTIAQYDHKKYGWVKGQPRRFACGHNSKTGKRTIGYDQVKVQGEVTYRHRVRAEQALGKSLPAGAIIHHADGSKRMTSQLVICQDQAYHLMLHRRTRVLRAGGNPNIDKICSRCKQVLAKTDFHVKRQETDGLMDTCKPCTRERNNSGRARRLQLRAQQA